MCLVSKILNFFSTNTKLIYDYIIVVRDHNLSCGHRNWPFVFLFFSLSLLVPTIICILKFKVSRWLDILCQCDPMCPKYFQGYKRVRPKKDVSWESCFHSECSWKIFFWSSFLVSGIFTLHIRSLSWLWMVYSVNLLFSCSKIYY